MDAALLERTGTPAAPGVAAREAWLRPFAPPAAPRSLRVRARLDGGRLTLRFVLEGELEDLELPRPAGPPRRRDGLWRDTCFEGFLAGAGEAAYREVNLAPTGDWAIYAFRAPREGMSPVASVAALEWNTHRVTGRHAIRFTVDLPSLGLDPAPGLELGAGAVLRRRDGEREYWALAHPGPAPDFHCRAAFLLRLP